MYSMTLVTFLIIYVLTMYINYAIINANYSIRVLHILQLVILLGNKTLEYVFFLQIFEYMFTSM